MPQPEVSVVIPLFNEEDNVRPLCAAIHQVLERWDRICEVIFVDDGSRDRTLERLSDEASREPRFRVIALPRNAGQTLAMAAGFARALGRVIVSMDGDLQNDPDDIPALVSRIDQGYDVACGWRKDRQDPWLSKTLPSKAANRLIRWMTRIPIHDNGCSLKAYRAEVVRSMRLYSDMHRFLPALSAMTGARITEVVVRHHPRIHGASKYGIARTFRVLGDMITIKMITEFGSRPGAWFLLLSLPWLLAGTLTGLIWLLGVWRLGSAVGGVLSSITVMFLFLAGHMCMLAVMSEILLANLNRRYFFDLAQALTVAAPPSAGSS